MPGCLIPGELEKIQQYVGDTSIEYVMEHFVASEGARVLKIVDNQAYEFQVPTLAPAQKPDGSCVFLDADGLCSIHEVSPFGCAYHDMHMDHKDASKRSDFAVQAQVASHQNGTYYSQMCHLLAEAGLTAPPLAKRRKAMEEAVAKVT